MQFWCYSIQSEERHKDTIVLLCVVWHEIWEWLLDHGFGFGYLVGWLICLAHCMYHDR